MMSAYQALRTLQEDHEDIVTFGGRLKMALTPAGFPDAVIKDVLIRNVSCARMKKMLQVRAPSTYEEALKLATEWEDRERVCSPAEARSHNQDEKELLLQSSGMLADTMSETSTTASSLRSSIISSLERSALPKDLAHEIADLLEDIQSCMFLASDTRDEYRDLSPSEIREMFNRMPKKKERHEEFFIAFEVFRFRCGIFQMRVCQPNLLIRLKTPSWMLWLNDQLPYSVVVPASL